MSERAEDLLGALSIRELQDIVERLEREEAGEGGAHLGDNSAEADVILAQVLGLKGLIVKMGCHAPENFAERIVAAALEADPVPDPTTLHRWDKDSL